MATCKAILGIAPGLKHLILWRTLMKMRKALIGSILALTLCGGVSFAQRGGGGNGQPGGIGGFGGGFQDPTAEMTTVLPSLTDDQKAKIKDKVTAAQQAATDLRAKTQQQMQDAFQGGDQAAIQTAMTAIQKDNADLQAKSTADIESVLTDDQKNTWEGYLDRKS